MCYLCFSTSVVKEGRGFVSFLVSFAVNLFHFTQTLLKTLADHYCDIDLCVHLHICAA